jgi:predicted dehydrogenase
MKKVRWGVIGAGGIAKRRTIPEGILAADNSELSCVFDVRGCEEIAQQFNTRACKSVEDLLEQDIDAVYIATPVNLHREQVMLAAAARKHVLCEKPLGLQVDEARAMVDACKNAGVHLGVGLMMRFHAHHQVARQMIAEGRLGTPGFGRAQLSCWYPPMPNAWRQIKSEGGGGALMDLGAHCIDLLEQFFGRVSSVFCMISSRVQQYEVEDTAIVTIEFTSGAKGVVDCLFNVPDESSKNRLELYGSEGSLLAEGTIGQSPAGSMLFYPRVSSQAYDARQARQTESCQTISPMPVNLYRAEIAAFADSILSNSQPPVDGEAGLWNQRVLAACYESAKQKRAIEL